MEDKLEQAIKDERKKSEQAIKDERKKSEQEMEEMRKTMKAENAKLAAESRRLENELDAVKETANDTAEWIATGVCLPLLSLPPSFTHRIPSVPTTVRSSAELSSAISLTVFKPGSLSTSVSPPILILARHRNCGGTNLKDRQLLSDLPLPAPSFKMLWLITPNPSGPSCLNSWVRMKPWRWPLNLGQNFGIMEIRWPTMPSLNQNSLQSSKSIVRKGGNTEMVSKCLLIFCFRSYLSDNAAELSSSVTCFLRWALPLT